MGIVVIILFLFISKTFSQPFEIAWGTNNYFSIDKFSNEIYYYFIPALKFYKTDLKTLVSTETEFPTIPKFANNTHFAVYSQQNNLYIQDFELDTTYLLLSIPQGSIISSYSFSPNDLNIFFNDMYYSFKDNKNYDLSFEIPEWNPDYYEWSSDSTIISLQNDNVIVQYYLYSDRMDTLFFIGSNISLSSFSYNVSENTLAYSIYSFTGEPPKLYLYDFETNNDSVLFNPLIDDSSQIEPCWTTPIAITSLNWSSNERRLGFINSLVTNTGGGLYTIELDSGYASMFLDCSNFGVKYSLDWLGNDTLIYYDASTSIIYGINVIPIINDVPRMHQQYMTDKIQISNYPNPFNPVTKIEYRISNLEFVSLKVYDILGNEITTLVNEEKLAGNYEIEFNASKFRLCSGIYIYTLRSGKNSISKKMIYLK